jgi:Polysaccharide lyase
MRRLGRLRPVIAALGALLLLGLVVGPTVSASAAPRPTPSAQNVIFTGDYETGNFSQWQNCQTKNYNADCGTRTSFGPAPNMKIIGANRARQGRFAAQYTVRNGDIPPFGGGERAEVASEAPGAITASGDERWYRWSMYFPADFKNPVNDGWFIVMQWHGNDTNSPPLAINIGPRGTVDIGGDGVPHPTKTLGPVRRGQWVDYTLHVLFSQDPTVGFVEGTANGIQTVPKTFRATDSGTGTYLKQGIYRDPRDKTTSAILHDGLTVSAPATAPIRTSLPAPPRTARSNPAGTPPDEN